jgi:UDP-N-acetylglucosamine acyltransferase
MSGMCSAVNMDIPAYVRAQGNMASVQGLNVEGMRRRGMSKLSIQTISRAYKLVYRENLKLDEAMAQVDLLMQGLTELQEQQDLDRFVQSIRQSKRGLLR